MGGWEASSVFRLRLSRNTKKPEPDKTKSLKSNLLRQASSLSYSENNIRLLFQMIKGRYQMARGKFMCRTITKVTYSDL